MRKVSIIGAGMTKFGERWDKGIPELIAEAGVRALVDANLSGEEIQAVYGGTMAAGRLVGQEHIGALLADAMGLNPLPSVRVEAACASGGVALRQAYLSVASGMYDIVVVGGVEKMTDVSTGDATIALAGAGDIEWEFFSGATFPALYALIARRHMTEFGTTEEQLAAVAVKNHENGSHNEFAQFQNKITIDQVLNSKPIADPLKILDCSPITDGAAAVVLASSDIAKKYTDTPIEIIGSAQASDTLALHDRESLTSLKAARVAAENAYKQAKVTPKDINLAEVHDCFTIAEVLAIEDLGFFPKGKGGIATLEGETALNSKISINTSGGLKACGHPVGATGVKQAAEITWQLRGEAGKRQVDNATIGLTHNIGGSGATAVVHIMKRAD
ncbi:thiolase domain-containing protein [Candidatus Micrarchaeota archaeon]|nr:thiolase domain-containing protein [Candidatus Micrarchaeota archaeon]